MKLFEPQVLIVILIIVLIIFGPKQLPELGKTLGKTMKSIREGMEDDPDEVVKAGAEVKLAEKSDAVPSDAGKASRSSEG